VTAKRLAILLALLALEVGGAAAQLISPGKLSTAHQDLEGLSQCVSCHQLGVRGVSPTLCLNCHEPLARRIEEELGYHGQLDPIECASCHKEHLGRAFDVTRFDTLAFEHADAGFDLLGSHIEANCSNCHTPDLIKDPEVIAFKGEALERTFLGLGTTCASCHEPESPHGEQFEDRSCMNCHTESGWEGAERFDHDDARYPLTGRHLRVVCAQCHSSREVGGSLEVRYRPVSFGGCADCHTDQHEGRFTGSCQSCHQTGGWRRISESTLSSRFDHEWTGFSLAGAHLQASCQSCHEAAATDSPTVRMQFATTRGGTYRRPAGDECADCHLDAHDSSFAIQAAPTACGDCHNSAAWTPSGFGLGEHQDRTRFELEGAHLAVPCSACHTPAEEDIAPHFLVEERECQDCHTSDEPHEGQFADVSGVTACISCHSTDDWTATAFDHDETDFALLGAHAEVTCQSCHTDQAQPTVYRDLDSTCANCHEADDPHGEQFAGRSCDSCHDSEAFQLEEFDHSGTRFPLDGAHQQVICASCHRPESQLDGSAMTRFRPMPLTCISCHGS
jgi:cytochrome c3-like protein